MNEHHVLYTTGCPKCKILEKKLNDKKVDFTTISDRDELIAAHIASVPVLKKPNGDMLDYFAAVKYVNSL